MSDDRVIVHKNRTNVIQVELGIDVSADTLTSEIRTEPNVEAPLVAAWTVVKTNGGADGKLTLTMDNAVAASVSVSTGYMDLKRVVGGEPVSVFDEPLEVSFRGVVTA